MIKKAILFFLSFSVGLTAASTNPCVVEFIGESEPIKRIKEEAIRLANYDVPILILGPRGSGKTLLAKFIHEKSSKHNQFTSIDFGAISPTTFEEVLFGREKNALTDQKIGVLEAAYGGTLLLDRIEEIPLTLQAELFKALEESFFQRVGGKENIKLNVRVIVATSINLEQAVREGKFNEDLYLHLKGFSMQIPSLYERQEDIKRLSVFILKNLATQYNIEKTKFPFHQVWKAFETYSWPGNVRELIQALTIAFVRANSDEEAEAISISHLPETLRNPITAPQVHPLFESLAHSQNLPSLNEIEDLYMQFVLGRVGGVKRKAAVILDMHRSTLVERLQKIEKRKADD